MNLQKKESLARFLNKISQNDFEFDNCSKRIQEIYMQKAQWIIDFLSALEAEKPEEDIERAYQMLECLGVPRERAKTISNGIDVLANRYRKDRNGFEDEKQSYAESYHVKKCAECEAEKELKPAWSEVKKAQNKVAELQGLTPPYDLPDAENRPEEK